MTVNKQIRENKKGREESRSSLQSRALRLDASPEGQDRTGHTSRLIVIIFVSRTLLRGSNLLLYCTVLLHACLCCVVCVPPLDVTPHPTPPPGTATNIVLALVLIPCPACVDAARCSQIYRFLCINIIIG